MYPHVPQQTVALAWATGKYAAGAEEPTTSAISLADGTVLRMTTLFEFTGTAAEAVPTPIDAVSNTAVVTISVVKTKLDRSSA